MSNFLVVYCIMSNGQFLREIRMSEVVVDLLYVVTTQVILTLQTLPLVPRIRKTEPGSQQG